MASETCYDCNKEADSPHGVYDKDGKLRRLCQKCVDIRLKSSKKSTDDLRRPNT